MSKYISGMCNQNINKYILSNKKKDLYSVNPRLIGKDFIWLIIDNTKGCVMAKNSNNLH